MDLSDPTAFHALCLHLPPAPLRRGRNRTSRVPPRASSSSRLLTRTPKEQKRRVLGGEPQSCRRWRKKQKSKVGLAVYDLRGHMTLLFFYVLSCSFTFFHFLSHSFLFFYILFLFFHGFFTFFPHLFPVLSPSFLFFYVLSCSFTFVRSHDLCGHMTH